MFLTAFIMPVWPVGFCQEIGFIEYGTQKVQLDTYNPHTSNCPVVILIHGAAGITGDRAVRYRDFAEDLMDAGMIAVNVHYFDSERGNWVTTIKKTVDYAETIPNADGRKIALVGFSLGGTVAIEAASLDQRVSLLVFNAGYLPRGFTKKDAAALPPTYMVTGSEDSAMDTLRTLEAWFKENGRTFTYAIIEGYGHEMPMTLFMDSWKTVVSFIADTL